MYHTIKKCKSPSCTCFLNLLATLIILGTLQSSVFANKTPLSAQKIEVNDILIELPLINSEISHAFGQTISTELKVINKKEAKPASFKLFLTPQNLEIIDIEIIDHSTSDSVSLGKSEEGRSVTFSKLPPDTSITLRLNLKLGTGEASATEFTPFTSNLKLSIKQSGRRNKSRSKEANMEWAMVNCAKSFHTALATLAKDKLPSIRQSLEQTKVKDKTIPSQWIFDPKDAYQTVAEEKSVCIRKKRSKRKSKRKCLEYRTAQTTSRKRISFSRDLQEIFDVANDYVKHQTTSPLFKKNNAHYFITAQIAEDLEIYLKQDPHPALCTGIEGQVKFYRDKMGGLRKSTQKLKMQSESARKLALEQFTSLKIALLNNDKPRAPLNHTAMQELSLQNQSQNNYILAATSSFSSLPQDILTSALNPALRTNSSVRCMSPKPDKNNPITTADSNSTSFMCVRQDAIAALLEKDQKKASENDLIKEVTLTFGDEDFAKNLPQSNDFHSTLAILQEKKKILSEEKKYSEEILTKLHIALATLEASYQLEAVQRQYENVLYALNGNLDAITGAHARHCTCGQ